MINLTVLFYDLTALSLTPVPSEPDAAAAQQGAGGLKNKTLWIVIAAVAGITLIAIIIITILIITILFIYLIMCNIHQVLYNVSMSYLYWCIKI